MSPIGKWVLENCDNDLRLDLSRFGYWDLFRFSARSVALHLGVSIIGGS